MIIELRHKGDDKRPLIDDRARKALSRVLRESDKPLAYIAGCMDYTETHLRQLLDGAHWGILAVAALAAATDQDPVEMLARELEDEQGDA